jgi:hypothetical protein
MNPNIPPKPEVCDDCKEKFELKWSADYRMWLCDLCLEELIERDCTLDEYDEDDYGKHNNSKEKWN